MHAASNPLHHPAAARPAGARWRRLAVAAVLAGAGPAFAATCTRSADLGLLTPAVPVTFGQGFSAGETFSDCWDFRLAAASDLTGTTTEAIADFWFLPRWIDVQSIALWDLLAGTPVGPLDATPERFGFTGLAAGSYQLVVSGASTLGFGTATYAGTLSAAPVSTVPEPSVAALLVLAMGAAGLARRKALPSRR